MAVYNYDYAERLTVAPHNTAQLPFALSLALLFNNSRAHVRAMYQHWLVPLPPQPISLDLPSISPSPFPMHLLTLLRGLGIHACAVLSFRFVHHRYLTVHLLTFFFLLHTSSC